MKWISGSHYFLHLFTNSTLMYVPSDRTLSLLWMQVTFCFLFGASARRFGRNYSSIVQDLKFDWSTQITWKREAFGKHKHWLVYSNNKAGKYFRCYLFWSPWDRWFIFTKQISRQPFEVSRSSKQVFLKFFVFLISLRLPVF